jgi:hypothetical protein
MIHLVSSSETTSLSLGTFFIIEFMSPMLSFRLYIYSHHELLKEFLVCCWLMHVSFCEMHFFIDVFDIFFDLCEASSNQ